MAHVRWYRLDTTHPDFDTAINNGRDQHTTEFPGTVFSRTPKLDGSEEIVKVQGASKIWRQSTMWADIVSGVVLAIYDRSDHYIAQTLIETESWAATING